MKLELKRNERSSKVGIISIYAAGASPTINCACHLLAGHKKLQKFGSLEGLIDDIEYDPINCFIWRKTIDMIVPKVRSKD